MKGLNFRFSKKLILIMSGIIVLGGGSGAAAVFVGADELLGPSYLEINGLECTVLETIKFKRDQRYWVRKYVVSEEPGDGMARIRTALRVARAVQEKEKADLVQVAVLDKAGPTDRARMRGRSIGAQVVYIPDPGKMPTGTDAQIYSAYYLDGPANGSGDYYGMRVDLPMEDVETLTARLTDKTACAEPVAAATADGHGAPAGDHGDSSGHGDAGSGQGGSATHEEGSGHGEAAGHSEEGDHGEAGDHGEPAAEDHGGQPAQESAATGDHSSAAAEHSDAEPKKDEGGFLASVKSMIFGSGEPEQQTETHEDASADPQQAPEIQAPALEPRTSAEGGKRWSKSTDADERRSEYAPAEADAEAAPPPADGTTAADAAGEEWLTKLRGEADAAAAADSSKPVH